MASATLRWDPSRLNAALATGLRRSFYVAKDHAIASRPNSKCGATLAKVEPTSAVLKATGLGTVFELGRKAGYPIVAGGVKGYRRSKAASAIRLDNGSAYTMRVKRGGTTKALKFTRGDGGFAVSVTGGAMAAEPYIKPTAQEWSRRLAQATMAAELRAKGFGFR